MTLFRPRSSPFMSSNDVFLQTTPTFYDNDVGNFIVLFINGIKRITKKVFMDPNYLFRTILNCNIQSQFHIGVSFRAFKF